MATTLEMIIADMEADLEYSESFPNSMSSRGEEAMEDGKVQLLRKYLPKLRALRDQNGE
jgi:hypothetical protein